MVEDLPLLPCLSANLLLAGAAHPLWRSSVLPVLENNLFSWREDALILQTGR